MKSIGFATFEIEDLDELHSRSLAYAITHELKAGDTIKTYEYFAWITYQWTFYRKLHGLSDTAYVDHAHFDDWLWGRT